MKVILAGGGTGGHLYPAIALAEELSKKGTDFIFMVSDRGIEREILSKLNYKFVEQNIKPFADRSLVGKINIFFGIAKEVYRLRKYFDINDKVILFGGFAAAISGLIALIRGCDLYIHEQNSVMGFTNRFFAGYAKKVFISFEKTLRVKGKALVSGNPVRSSIIETVPKEELGKTVMLMGGSQGSRLLNNIMVESARGLVDKGYRIIHQTGKKLFNETKAKYESLGLLGNSNIELLDYLDDINHYYSKADILVSRAGSGSIFEIMKVRKPAVFVPLKIAAENHQYFNALEAVEKGCGVIIEENNLNKDILVKKIEEIHRDYKEKFLPKLLEIKTKDSVSIILKGMNL